MIELEFLSIDQSPQNIFVTDARIGLVAFAGRAYIAAPLTLDHDFLLKNLERLNLGSIEDGTAIGSALSAALNRLRELKSKRKIIILMTDGQNNSGKVPPLTDQSPERSMTRLGLPLTRVAQGSELSEGVAANRNPPGLARSRTLQ